VGQIHRRRSEFKIGIQSGDGGSRPIGVGFLGGSNWPPSPPAMGLESAAVSSPNGVRGKAPAAVDFGGFAECVLKQQLISFKTNKLEPSLLSRPG